MIKSSNTNIQIFSNLGRRRQVDRRRILLIVFVFALMSSLTFTGLQNLTRTEAVSLDGFKAGEIISDYNMSRYNSMTEAEIQKFLESKNRCNNTNIAEAAKYPKVSYHIENGRFVCLFEEKFDTATGMPATAESKSTETAAHIIFSAANEYKINPQVLIVLLEKEQSLITDTWPNSLQYRAATGYGCPDTAACDSKYYGLRNQVFNAAKLFRTVLDGGWTNYPLGENFIQYNPNKDCGGTKVNIQNLATSALYRYTPYQPNKAALAAGYNSGDPCSAYGNRNFYYLFSNWFYDPLDDSTAEVKSSASSGKATDKNASVAANVSPEKNQSEEKKTEGSKEQDSAKKASIAYQSHLQDIGWESKWAQDGALSGTTGESRRLEAVYIKTLNDKDIHIFYQSHLQDIGWESKWAQDGALSGTTGESRRLEAVRIKLDATSAGKYDVYYRSHIQDTGWLAWTKNGEPSGSEGLSLRLEALEIMVVDKGAPAPASKDQNTDKSFIK